VPEAQRKLAGGASHRLTGHQQISAPAGAVEIVTTSPSNFWRGSHVNFLLPSGAILFRNRIRWLAPPANFQRALGTQQILP